MRILLDTNVIVDNLARRDEYGESLQILVLCENGFLEGHVTTATIMDVMYILRKYLSPDEIRDSVQMILLIVNVVPVLKSDIHAALRGGWTDLEDAVQAACAMRLNVDYIVTRNTKDFVDSSVPAITPHNLLKILNQS